ncbi:protein kinase subdomain-containing protein [Moniliophthora roreri MCA 2997]|nr:protein kinase subdomain-containing protein [Moniliophthora roreri MCA 2997]
MDEATDRTLNASLAKSWLDELDSTIRTTKERIHDRIHADYPQFERELETSRTIQKRLKTLQNNVDDLQSSITTPEKGLVPTLIRALSAHSTLAKEATSARIRYEYLLHLSKVYSEYQELLSLSESGNLPKVVGQCNVISQLLQDVPPPMEQTKAMTDLKRKFLATKARTEEQLSDAYNRSIFVSSHEVTIHSTTQVRQSEIKLSTKDILQSLSTTSLSTHLSTLHRDLTTHCIDGLLKQPMSLSMSSEAGTHKIQCFPSPPNDEVLSSRLNNLATVLEFLFSNLFSHLPAPQDIMFPRSLTKAITGSLLNSLLIPSLPSSFDQLSSYLTLVQNAVSFEDKYIIELLGNDTNDRPVKSWVNSVGGHYERQRRMLILGDTRRLVLTPENPSDTFTVDVDIPREIEDSTVVPVQEEDAWGFGSGSQKEKPDSSKVDDDWGFDNDVEEDTAPSSATQTSAESNTKTEDPDPADAWGWNDDVTTPDSGETTDESAWDDPWGENSDVSEPMGVASPAPSNKPAKVASRLERLANKGKRKVNGSSSSISSPEIIPPLSPSPPQSVSPPASAPKMSATSKKAEDKRPARLALSLPKETYVVSSRMREILDLVNNVLRESQQFADSHLIAPHESSSEPGSILSRTAVSVLDLYRSLYPVVFGAHLNSIEGPIRYSNNCLFLSQEVERIKHQQHKPSSSLQSELADCQHQFKVMGDSWYADAIDKYRLSIDTIISEGASGFTYTGEQDRYDECEAALNRVLKEIRMVSQRWKGLLTKSKYYMAVGLITDAALSRILQDILELPDIPEVESHRLSELCRILHALEGLFVEDSDQPSFVVAYVPSWLKYSYLSELLEASLADITYLFETGALVDFQVDELVRLVKALFADTPLRTNTINKIMDGHPVPSET